MNPSGGSANKTIYYKTILLQFVVKQLLCDKVIIVFLKKVLWARLFFMSLLLNELFVEA